MKSIQLFVLAAAFGLFGVFFGQLALQVDPERKELSSKLALNQTGVIKLNEFSSAFRQSYGWYIQSLINRFPKLELDRDFYEEQLEFLRNDLRSLLQHSFINGLMVGNNQIPPKALSFTHLLGDLPDGTPQQMFQKVSVNAIDFISYISEMLGKRRKEIKIEISRVERNRQLLLLGSIASSALALIFFGIGVAVNFSQNASKLGGPADSITAEH